MKSYSFIKSTFLKLTSKTYPYGTEDGLVEDMKSQGIFPNLEKDNWGNYYIKIGKSRTIFASHLDTACKDQVNVNHNISKQQIVTTDGKTILGADDKAGVTILLWLIKNNIPGLYYFFIGEEVGCVGSSACAMSNNLKGQYDRVISFDRRGTNSVITFQSSSRTCSDSFAKELSKQLNRSNNLYYRPDDTGVYTDSAEFVDIVSECTNISVGYQSEHTHRESQDLYHLHNLALACLGVDWENLPTKRKIGEIDSKWKYSHDNYAYGWQDYTYSSRTSKKTRRSRYKKEKLFGLSSNGKSFLDNGNGELVEISKKSNGKYDVHREKFLKTDFTRHELDLVREQYLDMNDPYDRNEYEKLSQFL